MLNNCFTWCSQPGPEWYRCQRALGFPPSPNPWMCSSSKPQVGKDMENLQQCGRGRSCFEISLVLVYPAHPELPAHLLWDGGARGACAAATSSFCPLIHEFFLQAHPKACTYSMWAFPHCCDQDFVWKISFTHKPDVTGALPAPVPRLESLDVPWEVTSPLVSTYPIPWCLVRWPWSKTFRGLWAGWCSFLNSNWTLILKQIVLFPEEHMLEPSQQCSTVIFWDVNEFGAWSQHWGAALNLGLPKASGAESEICLKTYIKPPDNDFFFSPAP